MAVYQRGAGAHIAERVQPEPGSDREAELEALAGDPGSDWHLANEAEPKQDDGPSKRPVKTASKGDWIDYAVSQGADPAEADKATKDDLIQAYGG